MKKGLLITGGSLSETFLSTVYKSETFNQVIVVDGALEKALRCKIRIDYLVGDFDTIDEKILTSFLEEIDAGKHETKVKRLIPEKDMTDTHVAIDLAAELGVTDLTIVGGIGTRIDHSLANIHLLFRSLRNGVNGCMINEWNRIRLIQTSMTIKKEDAYGSYVSLIPFTNEVTGVTLQGMKYPLDDHTLYLGDSLGVSNEITSDIAKIQLKSGLLLVIESRD